MIKIRVEINKRENSKMLEEINETRSWFFEKVSNTDNPLAKLIKNK